LDWIKEDYIDDSRHGNNNSLAECASRLQNFNCVNYGFTAYGVNASDYAKPTPLHSATGTWSDINGILTAPVSGATYTWTGWNATFTVTAASVEAVATRSASTTGQTTSSATGKDAGSMTGSATGKDGDASGATSTGAAPTLMAAQQTAAALMGLGGLAFALL
jgi:predicted extracellular nuclease